MLLALDTSTPATVVAVASRDGVLLAERRDDPEEGARPGHTTALLSLAEQALADAGARWRQLSRIGVGVGPGGFTGLRVGLATGGALAAALGIETVPVVSLDALASGGAERACVAVIDARRGEVFLGAYDAAGAPEGQPRVLAPDLVSGTGRLAIGDGAVRYRRALEDAGLDVPPNDDPRHLIQGQALATVAASGAAGPLVPVYLREPDAQPRPQ